MSKKFGVNSKSAEARSRKDAVKQANDRDKQQKLEDEYWRDDDKNLQKKQQRKDEQEKKDNEKLQRKLENQKLLKEELGSLTAKKTSKSVDLPPPVKRTQAQIQESKANVHGTVKSTASARSTLRRSDVDEDEELPIEENLNRLQINQHSARNIDQAIDIFQSSDKDLDSHPEKRMKAAFQTFEEENLDRLKKDNPSLRLSQLKQLLKKEWMKSPSNPFNKPTKPFNDNLGATLNERHASEEDDD